MKALTLHAEWSPRAQGTDTTREGFAAMACTSWRNPKLTLCDVDDPSPGSHDVVIDVHVCGICGSDTHCIETDDDGYVIFSGPAAFPCTLGHEFAGRVIEIGADVQRVRVGELVTAEGMLYCGECAACTKGHVNQCFRLRMVGFSHPGAFAERVVVHEKHCWSIDELAERYGDETKATHVASLVEPVGCALNGMFVAGPGLDATSHVAIFGCGPIGLGAITLASMVGAASITAFDLTAGRVDLAKKMGAHHAFNASTLSASEMVHALADATHGWGVDMVIEAAGSAHQTMPIIEQSLAPGGSVIYLGRTGQRAPVMLDVLVSQAARIVGARGHAGFGIFPSIIEKLINGDLDLAPMITHTTPLCDWEMAFHRSRGKEDGKILLVQS